LAAGAEDDDDIDDDKPGKEAPDQHEAADQDLKSVDDVDSSIDDSVTGANDILFKMELINLQVYQRAVLRLCACCAL